jgi:hypothetical protein
VLEERFGSWFVRWRCDGFDVRSIEGAGSASLSFGRVILPLGLVIDPTSRRGFARLDLDTGRRIALLPGVLEHDLLRFKRRLSAEVYVMVHPSPFGCSDCAREAGMVAISWDGNVCPGCRKDYCRNARCLRRLGIVALRDGTLACRSCGTSNDQVRRRTEVACTG